jgi:hypothetical protein
MRYLNLRAQQRAKEEENNEKDATPAGNDADRKP